MATAVFAALRALEPTPPPTVAVTVAARDLPAGIRLDDNHLETRHYPADAVPDGLAERPYGHVLASPLTRGEPLTGVRLVGPALAHAQPGEQALPLRLPDTGVAALLRPGDEVDLLATDPGTGRTRLAASGVRILAVPEVDSTGSEHGVEGALVVVSLSPDEVPTVTGVSLAEFLSVAFTG